LHSNLLGGGFPAGVTTSAAETRARYRRRLFGGAIGNARSRAPATASPATTEGRVRYVALGLPELLMRVLVAPRARPHDNVPVRDRSHARRAPAPLLSDTRA